MNRLSGETQQGLSVQILLGLPLLHSFLPGVGQDPFRNEQLRICYQMRQVREFLYGWLHDRKAREDGYVFWFLWGGGGAYSDDHSHQLVKSNCLINTDLTI